MKTKILSLLLASVMFLGVISGCTSTGVSEDDGNEEDNSSISTVGGAEDPDDNAVYASVDMNIAVLKGSTGMGMAKLMEDNASGTSSNNYNFTISADTSQVVSDVINGTYDIAALPTNSAAMLYSKTEGEVQLLAINTLGVLYLLQNTAEGGGITSIDQLRGETICTFGQGANPEYVLTYILESNGLTVGEDVFIDFKASVDEVLTLAASGESKFVMLPEPNVSVAIAKNPDYSAVLDLTEEWNSVSGGQGDLVMGCLVVTKTFADAHPEAVAKFLEEYEASVNYVNENAEAASELIAKYEIVPAAAVALKAIPNSHMVFIAGADMHDNVNGYYEVLFNANPQAVGGAVPDEGFYYIG